MADLRSAEELIQAYPNGSPEQKSVGMPYADFGKEAAYTVALGDEPKIKDRCTACGLRVEAWTELAEGAVRLRLRTSPLGSRARLRHHRPRAQEAGNRALFPSRRDA